MLHVTISFTFSNLGKVFLIEKPHSFVRTRPKLVRPGHYHLWLFRRSPKPDNWAPKHPTLFDYISRNFHFLRQTFVSYSLNIASDIKLNDTKPTAEFSQTYFKGNAPEKEIQSLVELKRNYRLAFTLIIKHTSTEKVSFFEGVLL